MTGYRDQLNGKVWIAAHRGISGGNLPCNSMMAFDAALAQGADVIELDISRSLDGTLYVFHPQMEPVYLRSDRLISEMHDDEVAALRIVNPDSTPTEHAVPRFEDVLRQLKGRCRINVDKFWVDIPGISEAIRREGMADQVIVKTPLTPEYIRQVEECAHDMPFMPVLQTDDGSHERLLNNPRIRYIGAEVVFAAEDHPFASPRTIEKFHDDGCILWLNTILYDYRVQLAAGHSDDTALAGDPDRGWGWAIERGYDILQTDWPLMLRLYASRKYPDRVPPLAWND